MKKVFISLTVFFCVVMIGFSEYYQKTETVLLVAELMAFEIEDVEENNYKSDVINTSLKNLGIVTYIDPKTNQFAALGHSLMNSKEITSINGICYDVHIDENASYENLETSKNLGNIYMDKKKALGYIYYDSYSGIYGKINNVDTSKYEEIETENRYKIKTGKASILLRLDGETLESYEVEILAINYFASNKNLRVKITDERLINKTGGIVQGMSGTPVIQNGKLVGAINCVNIDNAQDAFAIFIDKII